MTPGENVAVWRPRPESRLTWIATGVLAIVGALLCAQYLAGFFFLWSLHLNPAAASPLTVAQYAHYYGYRDDIRRRLKLASGAGLVVVLVSAIPLLLPNKQALHGKARFAKGREMDRAGLFAKHGMFFGRWPRFLFFFRYIVLGGQQGAIISAPPRSDKGTAVVVTNCLFWRHSLICQDPKNENWQLTAGWRASIGQECYRFDPLNENGDTACINPLYYVPKDPNLRITGVQRIGATLFPETPGTDPFWTAGGRGMFLGMSLYVLETPSLPQTLGEVLRQGMASDAEGFGEHWKRIISGRQIGRHPLSQECVRAISDIMDLAPVTASSIRKTFTSRLDLWANPLIDAATSRNDFDWRDMRRRPMSVYLGIQPGDLELLRPLQNLVIEQALSLQTRQLPEHHPDLRYQILGLFDETTAPGLIPILAKSISYLPGYNVRLLLVIQAFSQLREIYGNNNADTMMKSLAAKIVYAPKDYNEANEISQDLGYTTVNVRTHSRPVMDFSDPKGRKSRSVNVSEQRRALLLPQEVKELGGDREIIFYEGLRPILARKNRYYQDPYFTKRLLPPPAHACPGRAHVSPPPPEAPTTAPPPSEGDAGSQLEPEIRAAPRTREATIEDVERIDSLTLDDFAVDFSQVKVPQKPRGERLTEDELHTAVESFLATLRTP